MPAPSHVNAMGLPMPALPADPVLAARYGYALDQARYGHADADIARAIGGEEGAAAVAALGDWLERERMRGLADLAQLLHLAAASDTKVLQFLAKARLRWSDDVPAAVPPAQSIVISIPGLTLQDPTA